MRVLVLASVDATDLTSFNFNNAPHLSDDEMFGVTISSFDTSRCDAKVLTPDKVGEGSAIVMKGKILFACIIFNF